MKERVKEEESETAAAEEGLQRRRKKGSRKRCWHIYDKYTKLINRFQNSREKNIEG